MSEKKLLLSILRDIDAGTEAVILAALPRLEALLATARAEEREAAAQAAEAEATKMEDFAKQFEARQENSPLTDKALTARGSALRIAAAIRARCEQS